MLSMTINNLIGAGATSTLYPAGCDTNNPGNNLDHKISCRGRKPHPKAGARHGTPVNVLFTSKATGEKFKRRAVRVAGTYYLRMPNGWRECRKLAEKNGYDFDVLGRFGRKEG